MTDATARTAIVTGGARGIGAAIAARLAADGMAVGVLDLDEAGANAVAPGFIETEMTRGTAERLGIPFDEYVRQRAANIPVGRTSAGASAASCST